MRGDGASAVYEAYFGLRERPFSIAPDPRYLFLSRRHRDGLAHLLYGVGERGGFIQLTGAVGTGKTTLTRALLEQLPPSVDLALVLNPSVTSRELLVTICEELGIELPNRTHSTSALMTVLRDYLLDAFARGRHTVVLIDEAQNLSPGVLEQVRLLTNLETNREKLLQIILVGQPELRDLLARPDMRQVAQRVTARFHLTPLTLGETREYIRHRLRTAGGSPLLFSHVAIVAIHRQSGGTPRLINIICDRALLGAYAGNKPRVSLRVARAAAREVDGERSHLRRALGLGTLATAVGAAALAAAPLLDRNAPRPEPIEAARALPAPTTPQADTIDTRLQDYAAQLDPHTSLKRLFTLWGGAYRPNEGSACDQAQAQGLRCNLDAASWAALLDRNLPAVLELLGDNGTRYSVLLTGFDGADALLAHQSGIMRFPQAELLRTWTGSSVALWRPPAVITGILQPGAKGLAVQWLARQLDRIEARSSATAADVYDAELRDRVMAFQRAHGLAVDGIVGESTLLHLMIAAPDPGIPTLGRK